MSYVSLTFPLFTAASVLAYYLFPLKKLRWTVLLAASYVFYFFTGLGFGYLMLVTTLTTWLGALWMDRMGAAAEAEVEAHKSEWSREERKAVRNEAKKKKRRVLTAILVLNFGVLAFLKYYNLFAEHLCLWGFSAPTLRLLLPLGISFYTFQAMGYLIDVYRGKYPAERNPGKTALFVSFFPQIVQGPIGDYAQLSPQLFEARPFDYDRARRGLQLAAWGYFKKLVIADRAVIVIGAVTSAYADYDGSAILMAAVLYALQIYADFSGGIDISRGIAQILGIELAENFRRPYFSRSISEYWRRWHISLGAWMRNYVFYSLTTSKAFLRMGRSIRSAKPEPSPARLHTAKVFPTALASLIVFLLVGIWHGANLKYVGFGLWNGGIIMLSVLLAPEYEKLRSALRIRAESRLFILFQMVRTFFIVLVGYYFDIAPSFGGAVDMMRRSVTDLHFKEGTEQILSCGVSPKQMGALAFGAAVMLAVSAAQERRPEESLRLRLEKRPALSWLLLFLCIACTMVLGVYGPGYDSGAFVYMQF